MDSAARTAHWEQIYTTKPLENTSWYQPTPHTSLDLIAALKVSKDAPLLDVGGGDSFLAEHLLDLGYTDITVLDISEAALERARQRMGDRASEVHWIACDITDFRPTRTYAVWHDRAAFHFLRSPKDQAAYKSAQQAATHTGSKAIIGTFSTNGPLKCSGIDIQQYSPNTMQEAFSPKWTALQTQVVGHPTPFDTVQEFVFGVFERG